MSAFDLELGRKLDALAAENLYRSVRQLESAQGPVVRINGQELVNFSSNDYLGLASAPELKVAAIQAIEKYGTGAGASRLICGSLPPHQELDEAIATFKRAPKALAFSSGYAAALGAICALRGKEDVVVVDKLVHACIVDAVRLSGAKLRVFAHNDLDELEDILRWCDGRSASSRALIVTESVFSMDGDVAPLREMVALKERYGAWLMVDEAHAVGLFGSAGRGLADAAGMSDRIEVQMGTLGKAVGAAGGYICGSVKLIDYLVNRSRSFIFSTAPAPAAAAAAAAGIRLVQTAEGDARRERLWANVEAARVATANRLASSAILPVIIGDEAKAMEASERLRQEGILIPAVRYPTVARGSARLRLTLSAAHAAPQLEQLRRAFAHLQLPGSSYASAGPA